VAARTRERVDIRVLPVAALTAKEWDEIWELTQIYVETQRPYYETKLRACPLTLKNWLYAAGKAIRRRFQS
jgi:hypothetical protein